MLKADVLATILVRSQWKRDMDEGRAHVLFEFRRHRPKDDFNRWNTHVGDGWAERYIAAATNPRPDRIYFHRAFDELDAA